MYNKIKNPLTGRKVDIRSNLGKKIIKAYLSASNVQNGGISFKNRAGEFLYHIGTEEGNNALTACSACTMMALGLPDEIVDGVSDVQQFNITTGRGYGGISNSQLNRLLNDLNGRISPTLTSNIYVWGKAFLPSGMVPCVIDIKFISKRNDPNDPYFDTLYSTQKEDLIFLPFSGPPNPDPDLTYDSMWKGALANIFNNLNRGSSTFLQIIFNDPSKKSLQESLQDGHFVGISMSYNGTPYLIDAQQAQGPPYQGFWQGQEGIMEYFRRYPNISFIVTFNNSMWVHDGTWNWRLYDIDAELDIDIDKVFPDWKRGNPKYLDKDKTSIHPSQMWEYFNEGDIPESELSQLNQSRESSPGTPGGPKIEEIE